MKEISLNYLDNLYGYLRIMTDEEISDFKINNLKDRDRLFFEINKVFSNYGMMSKKNTIQLLYQLIKNKKYIEYWRYVLPEDFPLDEVDNKEVYIKSLYCYLCEKNNISTNNCSNEEILITNKFLDDLDFKK